MFCDRPWSVTRASPPPPPPAEGRQGRESSAAGTPGTFPIRDDRGIDPFAAVHTAPRRGAGLLGDFQQQRIRETWHHETPASGAGFTFDHGGSGGRSAMLHDGGVSFLFFLPVFLPGAVTTRAHHSQAWLGRSRAGPGHHCAIRASASRRAIGDVSSHRTGIRLQDKWTRSGTPLGKDLVRRAIVTGWSEL